MVTEVHKESELAAMTWYLTEGSRSETKLTLLTQVLQRIAKAEEDGVAKVAGAYREHSDVLTVYLYI